MLPAKGDEGDDAEEEVTITLDKELAKALHDVLMAAMGEFVAGLAFKAHLEGNGSILPVFLVHLFHDWCSSGLASGT